MTDQRGPEEFTRLAGLELELPPSGTGARAARRAAEAAAAAAAPPPPAPPVTSPEPRARPRPASGPSRRWLLTFGGGMLACVVAAGALAYVGVSTLWDSRAGRLIRNAEPDEPGFEGFLDPTPTLAVAHTEDGELRGMALVSLASDDLGGHVILLPVDVLVGDVQDATALSLVHAIGGLDHTREGMEILTGVGVAEIVEVDDARWTSLLEPVGALTIDGAPVAPAEIGPRLAALGEGESELDRLARQEQIWAAWLDAVAARPEAVPGEVDSGLGRFIRGLASGPHEVAQLPVRTETGVFGQEDFVVDRTALAAFIAPRVPYPLGTQFAPRTLVRLLDGTGDPDRVPRAAPTIVAASAAIVVVGNASSFDHDETEIRYHQPTQRAAAERIRQALGKGRVIEDVRPIDSFDVTIVLGTDL